MKKFLKEKLYLIMLFSFCVAMSVSSTVFAEEDSCANILTAFCKNNQGDIGGIVYLVLNVLTVGVIVAGTVGILVCGYLILTARENQEQVAKAKKRLFEIVIGLAAWATGSALIALFIPNFNGTIEDPNIDIPIAEHSERETPSDGGDTGGDSGSNPGETYRIPSTYELSSYAGMQYYLTVPENATNNMPLVIFLHGSGEAGDYSAVGRTPQATNMRTLTASLKFISLVPVSPTSDSTTRNWEYGTNSANLMSIIDKVANEQKVDKNRIYIWGFSMGGRGTFNMINNYPGTFRAATVISNCPASGNTSAKISQTPVRMILGSAEVDYNYYHTCMSNTYNEVKKLGGEIYYEELPGVTHDTMSTSLDYSNVIGWLLKYK